MFDSGGPESDTIDVILLRNVEGWVVGRILTCGPHTSLDPDDHILFHEWGGQKISSDRLLLHEDEIVALMEDA